jgi:hypothetical protein
VRGVDETRRALADTEPGAAPHSDLASSQQKNQARERPPSRCSNLETAVLWGATAAGLQGAAVAAGPALNRAYSGSVDVDAVHVHVAVAIPMLPLRSASVSIIEQRGRQADGHS